MALRHLPFLTLAFGLAASSSLSARAECPAPRRGAVAETTNASAVFAKADPTSDIAGKVPAGACLKVLKVRGEWLRVRLPGGGTGWLHQDGVKVLGAKGRRPRRPPRKGSKAGAAAREASTPKSSKPRESGKTASVEAAKKTGSGAAAAAPAKEAADAATRASDTSPPPRLTKRQRKRKRRRRPRSKKEAEALEGYVVAASQAPIHESRDDASRFVAIAQPGQKLVYLDIDDEAAWVRVRWKDDPKAPEGWIRRDVLSYLPSAARKVSAAAPQAEEKGPAEPAPAPPTARSWAVTAGAGYLALSESVRTDVADPMLNYAIQAVAAGLDVRVHAPISAGLSGSLSATGGYVVGMEVPVGGALISLSALALHAEANLTYRQPLSGLATGWLGAWRLLFRAGYVFSQFAPQQPANAVLFTAHTWHGGALSAGVEMPLPGVDLWLSAEGGPLLLLGMQWPETLGKSGLVLGWHAAAGLVAPLGRTMALDLRYRLRGQSALFTGGGTRSPEVTRARTDDFSHGLTAGVRLSF